MEHLDLCSADHTSSSSGFLAVQFTYERDDGNVSHGLIIFCPTVTTQISSLTLDVYSQLITSLGFNISVERCITRCLKSLLLVVFLRLLVQGII